ncbi:ferritin [Ruegeria atlantica]|uniref:ferritin n=1 Tax=Ruegeria atlantica TaxID=81569 RepID=UPI00147EE741|nr:ferritin [Ruegeria atlantica]
MSQPSSATTMNDLMNHELRAAHLYWQAGAWCVERNLNGCSELLLTHADEELTHMKKMLNYLVDCEWPIRFQALPEPKVETDTVQGLFQMILDHEKKVTDGINAAVKEAQALDDHSTFEFLQWFVMEQREEIKTFQGIIDRIKLIGDGPHSLYYIDKEVADISANMASGGGAPAV